MRLCGLTGRAGTVTARGQAVARAVGPGSIHRPRAAQFSPSSRNRREAWSPSIVPPAGAQAVGPDADTQPACPDRPFAGRGLRSGWSPSEGVIIPCYRTTLDKPLILCPFRRERSSSEATADAEAAAWLGWRDIRTVPETQQIEPVFCPWSADHSAIAALPEKLVHNIESGTVCAGAPAASSGIPCRFSMVTRNG